MLVKSKYKYTAQYLCHDDKTEIFAGKSIHLLSKLSQMKIYRVIILLFVINVITTGYVSANKKGTDTDQKPHINKWYWSN